MPAARDYPDDETGEWGGTLRILGIDPGSRATGYGIVDFEGSALRRVASGVVRPPADAPLARRLAVIYSELVEVIERFSPERAALEGVFAARNPRAALQLGQARGAALLACGLAELDATEYTPMQVKVAVVGYGRASKQQVQQMVERLLALPARPASDEADALAIAVCHGHSDRTPLPSRGARAAGRRRGGPEVAS